MDKRERIVHGLNTRCKVEKYNGNDLDGNPVDCYVAFVDEEIFCGAPRRWVDATYTDQNGKEHKAFLDEDGAWNALNYFMGC
jgi:hypothetical protein